MQGPKLLECDEKLRCRKYDKTLRLFITKLLNWDIMHEFTMSQFNY